MTIFEPDICAGCDLEIDRCDCVAQENADDETGCIGEHCVAQGIHDREDCISVGQAMYEADAAEIEGLLSKWPNPAVLLEQLQEHAPAYLVKLLASHPPQGYRELHNPRHDDAWGERDAFGHGRRDGKKL